MASKKGFTNFPNELLIQIFSHLTVEDIVMSVQHVNQRWREVVHDGVRWDHLVYAPKSSASENDIVAFLDQAPKLEVFYPEAPVMPNILQAVIRHCKFIKKLVLHVHRLRDEQVKQLVRECTCITHLHINVCFTDFDKRNCFNHISKCLKLISLKLEGRFSSGQQRVFKSIADGCPSLQHLDLKDLDGFNTSEDLQYLIDQKKDQLVSLYISHTLPRLESCTKLKSLYIHCFEVVNNITDLYVFRLPTLTSLSLVQCGLLNERNSTDCLCANELRELDLSSSLGIKRFLTKALLKNISLLTLQKCDEVTNDTLKVVSGDLEYLDIRGCCNLTNTGIGYLSKCHNIKYLDISCCRYLTFRTMIVVLKFESLEELKVDSRFIVSLMGNIMPFRVKNLKSLTGVVFSHIEFKVDFKFLRYCIPSLRRLNYEYVYDNNHSDYDGLHVYGDLHNCYDYVGKPHNVSKPRKASKADLKFLRKHIPSIRQWNCEYDSDDDHSDNDSLQVYDGRHGNYDYDYGGGHDDYEDYHDTLFGS